MKVTDYLIEQLIKRDIKHIFGYPGGVICHLIDSVTKYESIEAHVAYNEQGAAFAACGYAQASHKLGVAFSTSGPGATNLVTGIANAYFDSIPVLFITGQVDTYALNNQEGLRQRGFQETNVVDMVKGITKYSVRVDNPFDIRWCLEKAIFEAFNGCPGPVLLDLPADVQRSEIDVSSLRSFDSALKSETIFDIDAFCSLMMKSKRPVILIGNGVKISNAKKNVLEIAEKWNIPVVSSLPAFDVVPFDNNHYFGFIGTNGQRYANFVFGKSDLVISVGSRLDIRQIGLKREKYFKDKKLVRIDTDLNQLNNKVVEDESDFLIDAKAFLSNISNLKYDFSDWNSICLRIKSKLIGYDDRDYNEYFSVISELLPIECSITLDVGQNQIWFAQSAHLQGQSVFMSAGHGSMGYSLPAAIGIYYATGKEVYCFSGDGGLMMNLQELQFIKREKLPIKIICFNNYALGMIRGFQERNFNKNYSLTTKSSGWESPDFGKIATAFGMPYLPIYSIKDVSSLRNLHVGSEFIEICYRGDTNLIPNFGRSELIQDQLPEMERVLFDELMKL